MEIHYSKQYCTTASGQDLRGRNGIGPENVAATDKILRGKVPCFRDTNANLDKAVL